MKPVIFVAAVCVALAGCGGPEAGQEAVPDEPVASATSPELSCVASGGRVTSSMCCNSVTAFPSSCLVGACGCAPSYSHSVPVCACPTGKCFDGTRCVGDPRLLETSCRSSGGTVVTTSCCTSVGDFPSSCLVGACGCAPAYSHPVKTCRCPTGKCFDGTRCK